MRAHRVGVASLLLALLLPANPAAQEPPAGYFAPSTVVDLLRPDKPAAGVLRALEAKGVPVRQQGPMYFFFCLPETIVAGFAVRPDGMIGGSSADFDLTSAQVEAFRKLLRSVFGRQGQERCEENGCGYVMEGWTARIETERRGDRGELRLRYERSDVPGAAASPPRAEPAGPRSRAAPPPEEPAQGADWSRPLSRGPFATKGYRSRDGSDIWRTGDLPEGAPRGSLGGVWGIEGRYSWKYLTFFLGGFLFTKLPGDGLNVVVPKDRLEAALMRYELKGDKLTKRIGGIVTTHRLRLLEHPNGRPRPYSHKAFLRLYRSPKTRLCLSSRYSREHLGNCYQRLDLCPESWTLHGSWSHHSASVGGGVALAPIGMVFEDSAGRTSNTVASTGYIESETVTWRFRKDGSVVFSRDDGLTTAVDPSGRIRSGSGGSSARRGAYRLKGCELQVAWSNGKREHYFVRSNPGYDNPKVLLVDEVPHERK